MRPILTSPRVLAAAALALLAACGDPLPVGTPQPVDNPAPTGSAQPALAVGRNGRAWMSWLEARAGGSHAFVVAVRDTGGWSAPRVVAEGESLLANWADVPVVAEGRDGTLAAAWLVRGVHGYSIRVATSHDDGATWTRPVSPHTDGTDTEHGFVSWIVEPDSMSLVWLDGRQYALADSTKRVMQLAWTGLRADGTTHRELFLDEKICDCCQTSAVVTGTTTLVAYRNRTDAEIRDIHVQRIANRVVFPGAPVHRDNWHFAGCPVNGPSLAARGASVAVAWFTAAGDTARVRLAWSRDTGMTWGPAVEVHERSGREGATGRPEGRVQVVLTPGGDALVAWVEVREGASVLVARRIGADGSKGAPVEVTRVANGKRAAGFAKMVALDSAALVAWTDAGANRVRTALIPFAARP